MNSPIYVSLLAHFLDEDLTNSGHIVIHLCELLQEEARNGEDQGHDIGSPLHSAASVTWLFSEPDITVIHLCELLQEEALNGEDQGHDIGAPFHSAASVTWLFSEPDITVALIR